MKNINIYLCVICAAVLSASLSFANDFKFSLHRKNYDCNSPYALKVGTQENCEINCPNRIYIFSDRTCRLKIGNTIPFPSVKDTSLNDSYCKTQTKTVQNKSGIPSVITINSGSGAEAQKGVYFKGANGKCYKCSTDEAVNVVDKCDGYFCNKDCSSRINKHYNNADTLYSVLQCPTSKPLMDRFMMCWSCDEKTTIDLSFDQEFNKNYCNSKRKINHSPYSVLK